MRLIKALVVVVGALALVLLAHHFIKRAQPRQRSGGGREIAVVAEPVAARHFADRTEAIGTISANESVTVTPAVTERVAAIRFENGAFAEPGDVLVELEHAEESAELEEARVDLAEQQREFDRAATLRERDLVSQEELDLAQGYLDAARARVEAAEARLRDRIITAPFAGVLGIRRVSPGSLVTPGDVITTLDDLHVVKVDFTVPEALLAQVAVGQPIQGRATPWPDDTFRGRVTSVDSRVDPTTRAVAVQALVPNPEGKLRAGMLMTIELTCSPREALGVPERALLSYADKQYVYVVRGDQTVKQREVKLGARDVGWVEVLDGLAQGDTIVVDGLLSLRDGARVRVETAQDSSAQTGASPSSSEQSTR
jgi:membrane fusion protein (multidrug efflux system)